jgi:hypothetical protein
MMALEAQTAKDVMSIQPQVASKLAVLLQQHVSSDAKILLFVGDGTSTMSGS